MKCSGIVLVVLLSACGVEEASERPGSSSGKADSFEGENSPVVGLDIGQWATNWRSPSGVRYGWYWDVNVWIDLSVLQGYADDVGIRYRVGGGEYAEAHASYEKDLEDGWQKWGVDITPAATMESCYWCVSEPVNFEYQIFYTDPFGERHTLNQSSYSLDADYPEDAEGEGVDSPVVGLDIGQWATNWRSPSGVRYGWYWDVNVWIDLAVLQGQANDVGVRYRVNDGEYAEAYTSHESDLENAWQKWGVDIVPAATMQDCYWCESEPFNLEYEVFYTDSFGQYRTLGETFTYPLETEYPEGG